MTDKQLIYNYLDKYYFIIFNNNEYYIVDKITREILCRSIHTSLLLKIFSVFITETGHSSDTIWTNWVRDKITQYNSEIYSYLDSIFPYGKNPHDLIRNRNSLINKLYTQFEFKYDRSVLIHMFRMWCAEFMNKKIR